MKAHVPTNQSGLYSHNDLAILHLHWTDYESRWPGGSSRSLEVLEALEGGVVFRDGGSSRSSSLPAGFQRASKRGAVRAQTAAALP